MSRAGRVSGPRAMSRLHLAAESAEYTIPVRLLLTLGGAVLVAAAAWLATAIGMAAMLERTPGGSREGAGAMTAAFFFGPIGGLAGFVLGAWLIWRWTADPARHGAAGMALAGGFVLLLVVGAIAFSPRHDPGISWPKGMRGEAQVEIRIAAARIADPRRDALGFELRRGGATLETAWNPQQARREGGLAIVPAAFTLRDTHTTWIFAVMQREKQIGTHDIQLAEPLTETSAWSEWRRMEGDLEVRFRAAVVPR